MASHAPLLLKRLYWRFLDKARDACKKIRSPRVSPREILRARNHETIIQAISCGVPDVIVQSLEVIKDGRANLVAEVNNRLIFKFPHSVADAEVICLEAAVLKHLRGRMAMPLPRMRIYRSPIFFSRHCKIPGTRFTPSQYERLSEIQKDAIADELALFFSQLHSVPLLTAISLGARRVPEFELFSDEAASEAEARLPPHLRSFPKEAMRRFRSFAATPVEQVFGHFDCHGKNIAFDEEHGRINGIFDFADYGIGDFHLDICRLHWVSRNLLDRVIERYQLATGRLVDWERIDLHTAERAVYDLTYKIADENTALALRPLFEKWALPTI